MRWRLVLSIYFESLFHWHILPKYNLRGISALSVHLGCQLLLKNLWLFLKLPGRLSLEPIIHGQDRTIGVLLDASVDVLR